MLAGAAHQERYNRSREPMAMDERFEFLRQSIESHDRQIGELTEGIAMLKETVAAQTANIDKLVRVTNEDATAIRTLACFC